MSSLDRVSAHLEEMKVPMSVRKISSDLKLKKRTVKAICHQLPHISCVHASHTGSGRGNSSLFIHSSDPKWKEIRSDYS